MKPTPTERAQDISRALLQEVIDRNEVESEWLVDAIAHAIDAAVLAERDRCARIAHEVQAELGSEVYHDVGDMIARRIRESVIIQSIEAERI